MSARSGLGGIVTTIVLFGGLLTVPIVANLVFPRFAPIASPTSADNHHSPAAQYTLGKAVEQPDGRAGEDLGESAHYTPNDLLDPLEEAPKSVATEVDARPAKTQTAPDQTWPDPFQEPQTSQPSSEQTPTTNMTRQRSLAHKAGRRGPGHKNPSRSGTTKLVSLRDWPSPSGTDSPRRFIQSQRGDDPGDDPDAENEGAAADRKGRLTWNAAIERLNALGIREYQLEPAAQRNQFLFRCRFTPRDNPRDTYVFSGRGAEPLHAVEDALRQIEQSPLHNAR